MGTLGGMITTQARRAVAAAVYEGRVSSVKRPGLFLVKVRGLMGDLKPVEVRGPEVDLEPGTTVWVSKDEGQQLVLVAMTGASETGALAEAVDAVESSLETLGDRVEALESAPGEVHGSSGLTQVGSFGTPLTYTQFGVVITAGTWRLDGFASCYAGDSVQDYRQIALWNATDGTEVPHSRSPVGVSSIAVTAVPLSTSAVVTVAATKTIRLRQYPNGGSTPAFLGGASLDPQRIAAVRLA